MAAPSPTVDLLFIYGTLLNGIHEGWQEKVGARRVGRGKIAARLYDFGEYPGAVSVIEDSDEYVNGEVYRLNSADRAIELLDRYEEYYPDRPSDSLFIRTTVPVALEDGKREKAWVYFYNRPVKGAKLIPGGDYRDRALAKQ